MIAVYVVGFALVSMVAGVLILNHMWSEVHKELELCHERKCNF
jgi:hypothetical protein